MIVMTYLMFANIVFAWYPWSVKR